VLVFPSWHHPRPLEGRGAVRRHYGCMAGAGSLTPPTCPVEDNPSSLPCALPIRRVPPYSAGGCVQQPPARVSPQPPCRGVCAPLWKTPPGIPPILCFRATRYRTFERPILCFRATKTPLITSNGADLPFLQLFTTKILTTKKGPIFNL
jgi:hypothetical protein